LYWDDSIRIEILSYELHHIDTLIWSGDHHAWWRGTFVYGESRAHDKHNMWELIRRVKPRSRAPWLMIGDFNESMWQFEHFSTAKRSERHMLDFREVLSYCDLHDLGFSGRPWMDDNRQNGERNVKVRLDRVVASPQWSVWFNNVSVKHIVISHSDHCPILLSLEKQDPQVHTHGIARYEIMWEREASLTEEINKPWEAARPINDLSDFAKSLKGVMINLKK
jgi:hypothetical protein